MPIDISGLNFFMPVFSFLFVTLVVYLILLKMKILGESKFVLLSISFIMAIVFMGFSSAELFIQTLIPWFLTLLVVVFLILLIAGFVSGKLDDIMSKGFAWTVVVVFVAIILLVAIKVFNPVFHPDLIIATGEGTSMAEQIKGQLGNGILGSILLIIVAGAVAFFVTRE